ncbi:voltage-gated delayed rectifier potassium channel KCNH8-like isoform X2 [Babylonia areolata]|uniref:voltage-gated delayed rectifier potassium channel KCNH8-like isoform X2 n=1 Tax=Babylonia areolata TaxID=304850 RepID=UPI003FCF8B9A
MNAICLSPTCEETMVEFHQEPETDSNFVLGNAQAQGWPIVYCSDGFCELTGYGRAQVMAKGCACKFLYGEETSDVETRTIDEALEEKKEHKTELVLYKKNGTPFWCLMDIVPIKNEKRQVVLFLVSHKDITRDKNLTSSSDLGGTDINDNTGSMDKDDSDSSKSDDNDNDDMPDNYNYSRRRSRAVLYHISGQLNKQNKAKTKLQQLNRLGSQMPEYKVQEVKKSKLVIVHYGIFKIGWDWLILLCTFYIAIMVPFNAAFRRHNRYRDFMYIDAAVELLFAFDIVLNFRTSFVNKNGQVCYDSRLIALNYMRGWFLLDLLAAIPFDLLYAFDVNTGTLIHLLKVARLLRLARLLQKIERYSQYSVFVVAILMCMFALLAHWLACIWYAIGKQEFESYPEWTVGWLYELSDRINEPLSRYSNLTDTMTYYVTALYFTCSSLTSVGFGNVSANTNSEKIFSICAMLVGAMMHAVVFGNVTAFIQRMYARRATFHAKTKDLKEFFRFHHFPKTLKTRMQEYFQTMWSVNNGIDVRDIMKDFPEDLRGEISLHLNREIFSLPIFEAATQGCLRSVALQTSRVFFGPGEVLIHKGDAIRNIYYVCSGSLEVLKEEQVVAILGKGDLFGSDIKFEDPVTISGGDVRSLAYCELLCINTQGLTECLQPYPDFSEKFLKEFPNDLTYNLREGHEDIEDDDTLLPAINTLPVISEDEEDAISNGSDNDNKEAEKKEGEKKPTIHHPTPTTNTTTTTTTTTSTSKRPPAADDEEIETTEHTDHSSSTSPLLTKFQGSRPSFPNGDIIGGLRSSEPRDTPLLPLRRVTVVGGGGRDTGGGGGGVGVREGGGTSPAYLRTLSSGITPGGRSQTSSVKDSAVRPARPYLSNRQSSEDSQTSQTLVQHLQREVEGTRSSVDKLEQRLDVLCSDVKNISTTLRHILLAMGKEPPPQHPTPPPPHHPRPPPQPLPTSSPADKAPQPQLPSQAETQSPASDKPPSHPVSKVKTYMRSSPPRRVLNRQKSTPGPPPLPPQQGVSSFGRRASAGQQFFFGKSPDSENFNDLFTTACTRGSCGAFREEKLPPSSTRRGSGGGEGGGGAGAARSSSPAVSPVSENSRLVGIDEEVDSGRRRGSEEFNSQYYRIAGSDSENDLVGANSHSPGRCSPPSPVSPNMKAEPRCPAPRLSSSSSSRRSSTPLDPDPHPHTSTPSSPEPPFFLDLSPASEESLFYPGSFRLEPLRPSEGVSPEPLRPSQGISPDQDRAPLSRPESFSDLLPLRDSVV